MDVRAASVRVISIGGIAVTTPKPIVNQPSPVAIAIEARFVPPGTAIEIELFSDDGLSQTVTTTSLVGTLELSRATVSVTIPTGSSRCYVKAAWKQPPVP